MKKLLCVLLILLAVGCAANTQLMEESHSYGVNWAYIGMTKAEAMPYIGAIVPRTSTDAYGTMEIYTWEAGRYSIHFYNDEIVYIYKKF